MALLLERIKPLREVTRGSWLVFDLNFGFNFFSLWLLALSWDLSITLFALLSLRGVLESTLSAYVRIYDKHFAANLANFSVRLVIKCAISTLFRH